MTDVIERGNVYFFYRPRVEETSPEGLDDVQRMYMILDPHGVDRFRRVVIGQKKLPDVRDGGQRFWGFVDKVTTSADEMRDALSRETYSTKTRGEREQPAARPAGEGVYAIVRHEDHTHFAYALELPDEPGDVQDAMRIEEEASFVVSVKNPEKASPPGAGLRGERKADFPKALEEKFEDRRFADVDPPGFLDHEGAEILFVGAAEDVKEELGLDLNPQEEDERRSELLRHLKLGKDEYPRTPLLEGDWR